MLRIFLNLLTKPMAYEEPPKSHPHPTSGPWFTFDDVPPEKWRDKLNEMGAQIYVQMTKPNASLQIVLKEFVARITKTLRE